MLIDTHAHLNFNAYKDDLDEVIKHSLENDVWMINVGSQYTTSKKAVETAQKYPEGVYAAVGLHPIHLNTGLVKIKLDQEEVTFNSREENFNYEKYKDLAKNDKVVAIGETGFDYYYKPKTKRKLELFKKKQKEVLSQQLKLAKELNLPVIFHCRMAHDDLIEVISSKFKAQNQKLNGVIHGFVGTTEQLEKYLELGIYIGFNGIIFKTIEGINFEENIKKTPLERILIETDCPYLTPPLSTEALAKVGLVEGRNEPFYIKYIVEKIAKIKNIKEEEVAKITTENAQKLFKI